MTLAERMVEIGLASISAGLIAFAIHLWTEINALKDADAKLRSEIASIEESGNVKLALINDCRELQKSIIVAESQSKKGVREIAMDLFEKRGCNITPIK